MKTHLLPILALLFLSSCTSENKKSAAVTETKDSVMTTEIKPELFPALILYEDSLHTIALPFQRQEMLPVLKEQLQPYTITKGIGQQDGPDFPYYAVNKNKENLLFFSMDSDDTLKLDKVIIHSPLIADVYGLKVGDDYKNIAKKRKGEFKQYTDYHHHTYLYQKHSKIVYEISGHLSLPDTADTKNLQFTEDQLKDWKIEYVIWQNK
jgi:hypothetical protein